MSEVICWKNGFIVVPSDEEGRPQTSQMSLVSAQPELPVARNFRESLKLVKAVMSKPTKPWR